MEEQNPPRIFEQQNLSLNRNSYHRHDFKEVDNFLICHCGKKKLYLKVNETEGGFYSGVKSDGRKYSVRADRRRYFFPKEWIAFEKTLKEPRHRLYFLTLLHTGARAMEALHLKAEDFEIERNSVTFRVVKHRAAKKEIYAIGKTRRFFVSPNYIKEVRKYIAKLSPKDYLFLNNHKLPPNYDALSNLEKKKYYVKSYTAYSQLFKSKMRKSGIKDWRQFALHNIRKTYGNWMRIFGLSIEEICYRLGHDIETYLAHYGSPMIFTDLEKVQIRDIYGDIR